jgi:hypothetical protein
MDIHRFSSSYEIPPALAQFSGSKIAEREEKINIKPQKSPGNLAPISQLTYKDNAVDLVDEGTTPPQKLVLRTVRAEVHQAG